MNMRLVNGINKAKELLEISEYTIFFLREFGRLVEGETNMGEMYNYVDNMYNSIVKEAACLARTEGVDKLSRDLLPETECKDFRELSDQMCVNLYFLQKKLQENGFTVEFKGMITEIDQNSPTTPVPSVNSLYKSLKVSWWS